MVKKRGETSYKQTSFGIIPRSKLILLEIEGIKRAWDFVIKNIGKKELLVTPELIKKLHKIGFKWIFPEFGGRFRKIEVIISGKNPPAFYEIPQLIEDYCQDLSIRLKNLPSVDNVEFVEEIISFLAWVHQRFLQIHPFQDYNGRIARLLINVILLNLKLPPIELKIETEKTRKKYIEALQQADDGNYNQLEKIIREALEESLEAV